MADRGTLPTQRATEVGVCRTPWKIAYETRRQAMQAIREANLGGRSRPYPCSCDRWHLTHLTKRAAKQIARHRNAAA